MRAVQLTEFGGPEVLQLVDDAPVPEPSDGEVLIRVSRAGMNFADTHARENSYLAKYELPLIPGAEAAGPVERGAGALEEGQRVVALLTNGGYAEYAVAPAATTFPVPDGLDEGAALALVLQGLTAWHLYTTCGRVKPGESVVVIAAAGGVGSLAVQLGERFEVGNLIATASSEDKRELAKRLGAHQAIDPNTDDLTAALLEANGGKKLDVVFEMAGGRVFEQCLRALAPFGRQVAYGIASREPNEVSSGTLMRKSQSVVGFWLMHCLGRRDMMEEPLQELFDMAARGELEPVLGETYPLSEVRRAHEELQGRKTQGKLLLDPSR